MLQEVTIVLPPVEEIKQDSNERNKKKTENVTKVKPLTLRISNP